MKFNEKSYKKEYRKKNKIKIAKWQKRYWSNNKEKLSQQKKEHYQKNKASILGRNKIYYIINKDKIALHNREYYKNNKPYIKIIKKRYYINNKDNIIKKSREFIQKFKLKAMQHYSQKEIPECKFCGQKDIRYLNIDHTMGNGKEHRKEINRKNIYLWLVKNNFPEGFQVLCWACNMQKGRRTVLKEEF